MIISKIFSANPLYAKKQHNEENHEFRTLFERDRDRILYSKEFRRLNRKTQVFISGFDDHIRNRLTHTIEVAQISQTICNHLGLNEALTMAIAYGHDVGHTPFGHVGERTLNYFMNGCGKFKDFDDVYKNQRGFKHNLQGIRVVTELERISNNYPGLNLTNYTLWGILNHTGIKPKACEYKKDGLNSPCHINHNADECKHKDIGLSFSFFERYIKPIETSDSWTIEGLIVRIADEIAQRHHDLEDGLFANIIDQNEIIDYFNNTFWEFLDNKERDKINNLKSENNKSIFIYSLSSIMINFLVNQVINQTKINLKEIIVKFSLTNSKDFNLKREEIFNTNIFGIVSYSPDLVHKEDKLQKFLKNRILNSHIAQSMDGKSTYIIRKLINSYLDNPQQLPDGTINTLYIRLLYRSEKEKYLDFVEHQKIGLFREKLKTDHYKKNKIRYRNILMRTICDFIAGMTDDYAIMQYNKLYGTTNVFSNY
jgi:deoxyguanosinetriphosphate triphosphohydrolase, putative